MKIVVIFSIVGTELYFTKSFTTFKFQNYDIQIHIFLAGNAENVSNPIF